jgi:hypothetical protein
VVVKVWNRVLPLFLWRENRNGFFFPQPVEWEVMELFDADSIAQSLPTEVLLMICVNLSIGDLCSFSRTCRRFHAIEKGNQHALWYRHYRRLLAADGEDEHAMTTCTSTSSSSIESPLAYWISMLQQQQQQQQQRQLSISSSSFVYLWCGPEACELKRHQLEMELPYTPSPISFSYSSSSSTSTQSPSTCTERCRWKHSCLRRWEATLQTKEFLPRLKSMVQTLRWNQRVKITKLVIGRGCSEDEIERLKSAISSWSSSSSSSPCSTSSDVLQLLSYYRLFNGLELSWVASASASPSTSPSSFISQDLISNNQRHLLSSEENQSLSFLSHLADDLDEGIPEEQQGFTVLSEEDEATEEGHEEGDPDNVKRRHLTYGSVSIPSLRTLCDSLQSDSSSSCPSSAQIVFDSFGLPPLPPPVSSSSSTSTSTSSSNSSSLVRTLFPSSEQQPDLNFDLEMTDTLPSLHSPSSVSIRRSLQHHPWMELVFDFSPASSPASPGVGLALRWGYSSNPMCIEHSLILSLSTYMELLLSTCAHRAIRLRLLSSALEDSPSPASPSFSSSSSSLSVAPESFPTLSSSSSSSSFVSASAMKPQKNTPSLFLRELLEHSITGIQQLDSILQSVLQEIIEDITNRLHSSSYQKRVLLPVSSPQRVLSRSYSLPVSTSPSTSPSRFLSSSPISSSSLGISSSSSSSGGRRRTRLLFEEYEGGEIELSYSVTRRLSISPSSPNKRQATLESFFLPITSSSITTSSTSMI